MTSPRVLMHLMLDCMVAGTLCMFCSLFVGGFRLDTPCSEAVLRSMDSETQLYVSADELGAALSSGSASDAGLRAVIKSAELTEVPRCISMHNSVLVASVIGCTAYAVLKWHADGYSAVLDTPVNWVRDSAASSEYWKERRVPRDDLLARGYRSARPMVRSAVVAAVRAWAVVLLIAWGAGDRIALMLDSVLSAATATTPAVTAVAPSSWLLTAFQALVICLAVSSMHAVQGTLLPLIMSQRMPMAELVAAASPSSPLPGATPTSRFDLVLSAFRTVVPRSLQHYMVAFPTEVRVASVTGAGYSAATVQLPSTIRFVLPPWKRADNGSGSTAPDHTRSTVIGGPASSSAVGVEPGRLALPGLPASTSGFRPADAAVVFAWQERMSCGNWALFGGDVQVSSTGGSADGANDGDSPVRALVQLIGAAQSSSGLSSAVVPSSSPWLRVVRDLILCSSAPPPPVVGSDMEHDNELGEETPAAADFVIDDCSGSVADNRSILNGSHAVADNTTNAALASSTAGVAAGTGSVLGSLTSPAPRAPSSLAGRSTLMSPSHPMGRSFGLTAAPTATSAAGAATPSIGLSTVRRRARSPAATPGMVPPTPAPAAAASTTFAADRTFGLASSSVGAAAAAASHPGLAGSRGPALRSDQLVSNSSTTGTGGAAKFVGAADARAFIRSVGAAASSAKERSAMFAAVDPRSHTSKWRDLVWAGTALIDSTTVTLLSAAACESLPAAAAPGRPTTVPVAAPALTPGSSSAMSDTTSSTTAASGSASTPVASSASPSKLKPAAGAAGVSAPLPKQVFAPLSVIGQLERVADQLVAITKLVVMKVWSIAVIVLVFLASRTGLDLVFGSVYRAITAGITGLVSQMRPVDPAAEARIWASAGGRATSSPLPLTIDETIGAAPVDPRSAARTGRVLMAVLAPLLEAVEVSDLATSAMHNRSFIGAPAGMGVGGGLGNTSVLNRSGLSVAHLRSTIAARPSSARTPLVSWLCAGYYQLVVDQGLGAAASAAVSDAYKAVTASYGALQSLLSYVVDDVAYALCWPHVKSIVSVLFSAVAVAAGFSFNNASPRGGAAGPVFDVAAGSSAGGIIRGALTSSVLRTPADVTSDLLADVRAVVATAEMLTTLALAGLKGEDKLRQVGSTLPILLYSLASALVACATYAASPRYSGTVAWGRPVHWRGGDAGDQASTRSEEETVLSMIARLDGYGGGSMASSMSAMPDIRLPTLQVNVHLEAAATGAVILEHTMRSTRPALAALQSGEEILSDSITPVRVHNITADPPPPIPTLRFPCCLQCCSTAWLLSTPRPPPYQACRLTLPSSQTQRRPCPFAQY